MEPDLHRVCEAVQSRHDPRTTRDRIELLMSALQHKLLHRRSDAELSPAGEQSDVVPRRHVPPLAP